MEQIVHLHVRAPAKPDFGAVCNGCGVCCAAETCPLGRLLFRRRQGICPALSWDGAGQRYLCGLLAHTADYLPKLPPGLLPLARRFLTRRIAAGQGCDSDCRIVAAE